MATVQAKTVRPGDTILHPGTQIPLRVVEPKGDLLPLANNTVFAVDDEGGLFAIGPDQQVECPVSVPLVTKPSSDNYIVVASFERELTNDMPVLVRNFREGRITAD